jgi:4'-phosphopantetheinyl transferase
VAIIVLCRQSFWPEGSWCTHLQFAGRSHVILDIIEAAVNERFLSAYSDPVDSRTIHLWTVRLVASENCFQNLQCALSRDEKDRAQAFQFECHRRAFVIGRGLLREILGWHLGQNPGSIEFRYSSNGKPALWNVETSELQFNLAHSEDWAVYAIARGIELGVDVEHVHDLPDAELIASQFFSKEECCDLVTLHPNDRREAFFNCWTRKEAYLKALGIGLSAPLDRFQVSLEPGRPAKFLRLDTEKPGLSEWTLYHLTPTEGFVGALAVPVTGCHLEERKFSNGDECLEYLRFGSPQKCRT